MELRLNNVGIIEETIIKIDGLTIITGKNNSGKSTVGKTLFAIIDAVEQIEFKALNDIIDYTRSRIEYSINELELRYLRNSRFHYNEKNIDDKPELLIEQIAYGFLPIIETIQDAIDLIKAVINEFKGISLESISVKIKDRNKLIYDQNLDQLEIKKKKAINILEELIDVLLSDHDLIEYSNTSILRTLLSEFSDQIHPVEGQKSSSIILRNNDEIYFNIKIDNNSIFKGSHSFISSPFQNSFLIDNAFVINGIKPNSNSTSSYIRGIRYNPESSSDYQVLINNRKILLHNQKLEKVLSTEINKSIIEENVIKAKSNRIMDIINSVLPGSFKVVDNKFVYGNSNLNIQNLATGAKMFAILKLLIEKDFISSKTMLILDEPEIHLHPEWQNIFAEILVLLVKEIGLNILLTTHSPNFLLAIDVFTKKHNMKSNLNYYLAQRNDNDCTMTNVSENLEEAFTYLVTPYLDLDILRLELQNEEHLEKKGG